MRLFGLNISRNKRSAAPTNPLDDKWYVNLPFMQNTAGGALVTPETALTHTTVYACVKVISETLSMLPLVLYKRKGDGTSKDRAADHPLFQILKNAPNDRMTSMEFREMLTGHYLLRGNAYAQIIRTAGGEVDSLWPLHPARMEVKVNSETNRVEYHYRLSNNQIYVFDYEEIFHLRGPSDNGLTGRTPLDCWREAVGLGMSIESYNANFFGNSAAPAGVITMGAGQELSDTARERFKEDWQKKFGGTKRAGGVALLEEGMAWQGVGMTSTDAQMLETDKNQDLKIARAFRMPPHKIGMMEHATYSNIEFQAIEFLTDTMMPHLIRWEQAITRDLLRGEKPDKFFSEFMVDAILRGDTTSRYKAYSIGRQWGWLSVNDIRGKENMNPVDGGDVYLQPLNMIEASKASDYLMKDPAKAAPKGDNKDPNADPGNPTIAQKALQLLVEERLQAFAREVDARNVMIGENVQQLFVKIEENNQKLIENLPKPAPIPEKPAEIDNISDPGFFFVRQSAQSLFAESISLILRREINAVASLRRKKKDGAAEEEFYVEHREFAREKLVTSVALYMEQVRMLGSQHSCAVVSDAFVKRSNDEAINRFIDLYFEKYKNVGERVDEASGELAVILSQTIEKLAVPVDIKCAPNAGAVSARTQDALTSPHQNGPMKVEFPPVAPMHRVVTVLHDENGKRVYDIKDIPKGEMQ